MMTKIKPGTQAPPFQVQLPEEVPPLSTAASSSQANWSGYEVVNSKNSYTVSETFYDEPSFDNDRCSSSQEVTWTGIGGNGNGDPLGQDGTGHVQGQNPNHYAWYEIVPPSGAGGEQYLPNSITGGVYTANANDPIVAYTQWDGSGYFFWLYDFEQTDAADITVSAPASDYSGDSAESIAERPAVANSSPPSYFELSSFSPLDF